MTYRKVHIAHLHIRAISDEIGERLRLLTTANPLRLSHRLLVLMQRLAKAERQALLSDL
jgi:hypothetical protein